VGLSAGRWFGREQGWVAALAAVTAPLPLAFSRIVILDSLLALLVTASLLAFHAAVEARVRGRSAHAWTIAAWALIGLGVLTKGPVALALPLFVAAPYALWRRASWAIWNPLGPLAAVAIVAPWVWFMEARLPGYLQYVAITETWQRVSSDELQRTQPWWFFLAVAGAGFFPWWPLAMGRQKLDRRRDPDRVFATLWVVVPLVLFSLSRSKLPQYILPLMPAVALLVASRWDVRRQPPIRAASVAILGWVVLTVIMAAAGAGALDDSRIKPEILRVLPAPAIGMAIVTAIAVVWAIAALRGGRGPWLAAALSLPMAATPVVLEPVIAAASERRSERSLVTMIRTELPAETEVIGLETWRPSVSFYLQRPIPILSRDGHELRSNYIMRTYDRWVDPEGTLRPAPNDPFDAAECDQPTVVLVHAKQIARQEVMVRAGLERVWVGPKLHAFFCDPDPPG
jgi:4-amino-4-deoxy-L-arabinose transferase-like glycosyltransferase